MDFSNQALPGQYVTYKTDQGIKKGLVKECGWVEVPNGKVWTCTMQDGEIVPVDNIIDVAPIVDQGDNVCLTALYSRKEILKALDTLNISMILKTCIYCLLEDDIENLELAAQLLNKRIKQLIELKNILPISGEQTPKG